MSEDQPAVLNSSNAYWHRAHSPAGFYDHAQHVVVLPNIIPRPAVVVDHEISHVNLINLSSIGLLEQLCIVSRSMARTENAIVIDELLADLMDHTVQVHEGIAWLGTELNTQKFEKLIAPPEYRTGVNTIRDALSTNMRLIASSLSDNIQETMHLAEAVGIAALSPPCISDWFGIQSDQVSSIRKRLRRSKAESPWTRFSEICSWIYEAPTDVLDEWATRIYGTSGERLNLDLGTRRGAWFGKRYTRQLIFAPRKSISDEQIARAIINLTGSSCRVEEAKELWRAHLALHTFLPGIDRYAQTCIAPRPRPVRPITVPSHTGKALFSGVSWLFVTCSISEGFSHPTPLPENTVTVGVGPKEAARRIAEVFGFTIDDIGADPFVKMELTASDARAFLQQYANDGGGIVADGVTYDYGCTDFTNMLVLRDVPHAVMAASDFKTLWMKMAFFSSSGVDGAKEIEYTLICSAMAPKEFGAILLKPKGIYFFPLIFSPCLVRYVDRVVSVAEHLPSPHGVRLIKSELPLDVWSFGCRAAFDGGMQAIERDFEQPEHVLSEFERIRDGA